MTDDYEYWDEEEDFKRERQAESEDSINRRLDERDRARDMNGDRRPY